MANRVRLNLTWQMIAQNGIKKGHRSDEFLTLSPGLIADCSSTAGGQLWWAAGRGLQADVTEFQLIFLQDRKCTSLFPTGKGSDMINLGMTK